MTTEQDVINRRGVPAGTIAWWAGDYNDLPVGFLLCDDSAISRTVYADLFAAISTRFGIGDGGTTFNLPDIIERFIQGIETDTTDPSASGGATANTNSANGGGIFNKEEGSGDVEMIVHTHTIADIRPPFLELVPIIAY